MPIDFSMKPLEAFFALIGLIRTTYSIQGQGINKEMAC